MLNLETVKNFCFDVLGDFVNPTSDVEIQEGRNSKFTVIVLRTHGIPKDLIRDEWDNAIVGTELSGNVMLFI